jgi:hypothetical protein
MSTTFRIESRLEAVPLVVPPAQERPYLLLEDLLDAPFEWSLCDVNAPPQTPAITPVHAIH